MILWCCTMKHWTHIWRAAASSCLQVTEKSTFKPSLSNTSPTWWDEHWGQWPSSVQPVTSSDRSLSWQKFSRLLSRELCSAGWVASALGWRQRQPPAQGHIEWPFSLCQSPVFNPQQHPNTRKAKRLKSWSVSPGYLQLSLHCEHNSSGRAHTGDLSPRV